MPPMTWLLALFDSLRDLRVGDVSVTDNALHALGGALILGALALYPSAPLAFFVGSAFGLLREQAQRAELGWVGAFREADGSVRWRKILEGTSWGIGAAIAWAILS